MCTVLPIGGGASLCNEQGPLRCQFSEKAFERLYSGGHLLLGK